MYSLAVSENENDSNIEQSLVKSKLLELNYEGLSKTVIRENTEGEDLATDILPYERALISRIRRW